MGEDAAAHMKYPKLRNPKRQNVISRPLGPVSGMIPPATRIRYQPYLHVVMALNVA